MLILFGFFSLGIAVVWLYGKLLENTHRQKRLEKEKLMKYELLQQQNQYFADYYRQLEKRGDALRRIRHDMTNNYVLELSYLEQGKLELLKAHYEVRLGQMKKAEDMIYTGNIGVDSLLNYKLQEAEKKQIAISWSVQAGSSIRISDWDLNILLGNLLDNAIEGTEKTETDKRNISFTLQTDATTLCFQVRNSCRPTSALCRGKTDKKARYLTTDKENKEEHGLGMGQIRSVVRKHQGQMEIRTGKDFFEVLVFLYMKPEKGHFL